MLAYRILGAATGGRFCEMKNLTRVARAIDEAISTVVPRRSFLMAGEANASIVGSVLV
jgi:hypothetical protein